MGKVKENSRIKKLYKTEMGKEKENSRIKGLSTTEIV
jgi:hypothetical protein